VSVVCCQIEFSVSDRSLVQRSPTERSVSEGDREAFIIRRTKPTGGGGGGCCPREKKRAYTSDNQIDFHVSLEIKSLYL